MKSACELPVRPSGSLRPLGLAGALLAVLVILSPAGARADAPTKAEAAALLQQFRGSIWSESTYGEFDLRQMPRHGAERLYHGRFWGSRNAEGPLTRFEIFGAKDGPTRRLLVQGGPESMLWIADGPGPGKPSPGAMLEPLLPGLEIAPFDLLPMPYLYWLDADLVSVERVRGREANIYLLTAPADFAPGPAGIRAVRAYLDAQYNALEQSETLRGDGTVAKTLTLLELRKVGSRWIPKDMDVRTEATRDKTRVSLTAIGVGIALPPSVFDPQTLGTPVAPPPADKVTKITQ